MNDANALSKVDELLQKMQQLEFENAVLRWLANGLEETIKHLEYENAMLECTNAELLEDKERLDSGMIRLRAFSEWGNEWCIHTRLDLRAAIDSARAEEAKP